jgi:hypothetical protein
MSRCYALTNKGTPCRNYGTILSQSDGEIVYSPTCKHHNGYDFKKHLVTRAQSLEWDSVEYNYFKRVLEDGVLEIEKEDINSLPKGNYTHFLSLCSHFVKDFKFDWNTRRSQAALANLWWQSRSVGPIYVSKSDVITLASTSKNPLTTLSYCLAAFPGEQYQEPTKEEWIRFLDYFFDNSDSGKISLPHPHFLSKEFSEKTGMLCDSFKNKFMKEFLKSGDFTEYVKGKKQSFYKKQKESIDSVKEELVMVTWHPDRFVEWCMDWEEKKWIQSEFEGLLL